jgi:chromosomal replication initiator protein
MANIWDQVKEILAQRISRESFQNWVAQTQFLRSEGDAVLVRVPDEISKEWLEREYVPQMQSILKSLAPGLNAIELITADKPALRSSAAILPAAALPVPALPVPALMVPSPPPVENIPYTNVAGIVDPRNTFESFVVGSCNQFAHAAAQAVATRPSQRYNPLFIYGGTGLGKTHLMQAINRSLMDTFQGMRIIYTTSERFMNQMVQCLRDDRMPAFHQYYRSADALLIDDIHTLAGKERTQEEFFHTFNDLLEHQKQIVISSDRPPSHTSGITDRLRSRFEWGLMVDMQPPDLETKMAILDKRALSEGITLPEDVRIFLATRTRNTVRELEGALIRLIAYASMTRTPISLSMAQDLLKNLSGMTEKKITVDLIMKTVAERYSLQPGQLKMKSNERRIAYPRQIAMFICREMTEASLPEIGRHFGGKHHTTVLHSIQKIESQRKQDQDLHRTINNLIDSLSN